MRHPMAIIVAACMAAGSAQAQDMTSMQGLGSMAGHDAHMLHIRLSPERQARPGDAERARQVARDTAETLEQFRDHRLAREEGYTPFGDGPDADVVHFVHIGHSIMENWRLDTRYPGALLYRRHGADDYELIGAMYVAPADAEMAELDRRVPLSQTRWHQHVDICTPRPIWNTEKWEQLDTQGRMVYCHESPIATRAACDAVGGRFHDVIFGWMVHVYPFREDPAAWWYEDWG